MRRLAIVMVLLCAAGSAAADDDGMLKRMVGDWIGQGIVRLKADEEPQRLYCKITGTLDPGGHSLRQIGRCALPDLSVAVEAVIEAVGAGRYRGSGGRRGNPPAATFTGVPSATSWSWSPRPTTTGSRSRPRPSRSGTMVSPQGRGGQPQDQRHLHGDRPDLPAGVSVPHPARR